MKPWQAIGMSRSTWYRRGRPTSKPTRRTQAELAASQRVTVRSMQRALRIAREAPQLQPLIMAGELSLGVAEKTLPVRPDRVGQGHDRYRARLLRAAGHVI